MPAIAHMRKMSVSSCSVGISLVWPANSVSLSTFITFVGALLQMISPPSDMMMPS
jgi:hypothetical protein